MEPESAMFARSAGGDSERSEFLLSLMNAVADPIFVKDDRHRWILLNNAFCSLIGMKREELLGKSDYDFFPRKEADTFWEKDRLVFETGKVNENEESFTDQSGVARTILTIKSRYVDPSGNAFLIGTIRDISRAKEAEVQRIQLALESRARAEAERQRSLLQESSNRLTAILNALPVGVFVLGRKGEIVTTNAEVDAIWRGKTPPAAGISDYRAFRGWWADTGKQVKPDEWAAARAIREGKTSIGEVIDVERMDGSRGTILNSAVPLRDSRGNIDGAVVVNSDVTSLKKAEIELREAKDAAEAASRVKSEFLDIAAHELRTPITPLQLLTENMMSLAAEGKTIPLEHMRRVRRQVERLTELVNDLLNASRLERGTLPLHLVEADLVPLVRNCVKDLEGQAGSRSLSIESDLDQAWIRMDPSRICQVVANFLDNALKYATEGSPIKIRIRSMRPRFVRVEVIDHGPGIPAEVQSSLFTRFHRISGDAVLRHPGLGLGLYICSRIAELHGGKVGLKSELGKGSTFFVELSMIDEREPTKEPVDE